MKIWGNLRTSTVRFSDFDVDPSYKKYLRNSFYELDGMTKFCFTCADEDDLSQVVLKKIYDAVYASQQGDLPGLREEIRKAEEKVKELYDEIEKYEENLPYAKKVLNELKPIVSKFRELYNEYSSHFADVVDGVEALNKLMSEFDTYENLLKNFNYKAVCDGTGEFITEYSNRNITIEDEDFKELLNLLNNSIYKETFNDSTLTTFVENLKNSESSDYKNTLFRLATNKVPERIVGSETSQEPLFSESSARFSGEIISNFEAALPDNEKKNFVIDCFNYLADAEKEGLATNGGATKGDDGKWTYNGNTYDTVSNCLNENFENFFKTACDSNFFESATQYTNLCKSLFKKLVDKGDTDATAEVKRALVENSLGEGGFALAKNRAYKYQQMFSEDIIKQAKIIERCFYSKYSGDRPNKSDDTSDFKKDADWDGLCILREKYRNPKEIVGEEMMKRLKEEYGYDWPLNQTPDEIWDGLESAIYGPMPSRADYDAAVMALDDLFKEYGALRNSINDLLNISLRYSALDGTGKKITSISCGLSGIYKIGSTEDAGSPAPDMVTAEKAMKRLAIHYYALAICLEKAYVVLDIMSAQLEQIEALNREIEMNNGYLKLANAWYSEYYGWAIDNSDQKVNTDSVSFSRRDEKPDSAHTLEYYVQNICGYSAFRTSDLKVYQYDVDGKAREGKEKKRKNQDFSNIDVVEQGNLTMISNGQEAIRMYGDKKSTEQQVATTKLQQYVQNYASCISICSQLAKSIGEYLRSIWSNIRF